MTKRQEALAEQFMSALNDEDRVLFGSLFGCLTELGYVPQKERANLTFKHDKHHKQIAKMGMKKGTDAVPALFLRFSACRGYSERFEAVVRDAILRSPSKAPRCTEQACDFCRGDARTHIYTHVFPDGERAHCGAFALEIPNLTSGDLPEIKGLLREEHAYLLKHEAVSRTPE